MSLHGSRVVKTLLGLTVYHRKNNKHGRIYLSPATVGELGGQSGRSVQRARDELAELELLTITKTAGGKTLDEAGQLHANATGWELHESVFSERIRALPGPSADPETVPGPFRSLSRIFDEVDSRRPVQSAAHAGDGSRHPP